MATAAAPGETTDLMSTPLARAVCPAAVSVISAVCLGLAVLVLAGGLDDLNGTDGIYNFRYHPIETWPSVPDAVLSVL